MKQQLLQNQDSSAPLRDNSALKASVLRPLNQVKLTLSAAETTEAKEISSAVDFTVSYIPLLPGEDAVAMRHRRLHRLLCESPPRHQRWLHVAECVYLLHFFCKYFILFISPV